MQFLAERGEPLLIRGTKTYWGSLQENTKSKTPHMDPSDRRSGNKDIDTFEGLLCLLSSGCTFILSSSYSVPSFLHIPLRHSKLCTCSGLIRDSCFNVERMT